MLREITNWLKGRKKTADININLKEAIELLNLEDNNSTAGNMYYRTENSRYRGGRIREKDEENKFRDVTLGNIADFLGNNFNEIPRYLRNPNEELYIREIAVGYLSESPPNPTFFSGTYVDIRYQTYNGRDGKRYEYIDLKQGNMSENSRERWKDKPLKRASIDYVVNGK